MLATTRLCLIVLTCALVLAGEAFADPMKCSVEEKTCQQNCARLVSTAKSACLTDCGVRKNACMRSGCWDNGQQRYCGLAKQ